MVQHIGRRLTLKQSANDTFIIGGGWPARPEPRPRRYSTTWESMAGNVAVAVRVMPLLADVRIVRTWSGVMAFTNDLAPMVGESRRLPGYHTLMATTGFTLSPLMARLLAETMATGRNAIPPALRRRSRVPRTRPRPEEAEHEPRRCRLERLLARLPDPVHRRAARRRHRVAARAHRVVRRRGDARRLHQRHDAASGSPRRRRSAASSPRPRSTRWRAARRS